MPMKNILLIIFIVLCVVYDIKFRKVPNIFTFTATVAGVFLNIFLSGFSSFPSSLAGIAVGFVMFFPFYFLGGMGAGDVKFMMAAGSIIGYRSCFFSGLYGSVLAGIAAVIVLTVKGKLIKTMIKLYNSLLVFLVLRNRDSLKFEKEEIKPFAYTIFLSAGIILEFISRLGLFSF